MTARRRRYLDVALEADALEAAVLAEAARLAQYNPGVYAETKRRTRGDLVTRVRDGLAEDVARISGA